MSLIADLYVSTDDAAIRYDTEPKPFPDRAQYSGFTPLELSMLWAIVRGIKWDVTLMDDFECLLQLGDGERLIHRLPPAMITELASLPHDRVTSITSAWAGTQEMGCSPKDIRPVVDNLIRFAEIATVTSRSVYLWNSV